MENPFDGLDPELLAVADGLGITDKDTELPREAKASQESIRYARELLEKCNYSEDDYDWDTIGQHEVSQLIDELKSELGWD